MIYVLAYPQFSAEVTLNLAAFRQMHEPEREQLVAPHITLVFGIRNSSPKDMTTLCERVASKISAISVEFSESEISHDPFENKHKISLLCTDGASELTSLHRKLYEGPHSDEFDSDVVYRPHMTVGANENRYRLEGADITSIGTFPIMAEIDGFSVVQLTSGGLRTISSVKLLK